MGYFRDAIDMFSMDDKVFKRVGNNKKSFKRVFWADIITNYILGFLVFGVVLLYLSVFVYAVAQKEAGPFSAYALVALLVFLFAPFLLFGLMYVFTFPLHLIGLLFGGKPKNYNDFFKVLIYPYAVFGKLIFFVPVVGGVVWLVLSYIFLYKTYKNIHRLGHSKAVGATFLVIGLQLLFFVGSILLFFFLPLFIGLRHVL